MLAEAAAALAQRYIGPIFDDEPDRPLARHEARARCSRRPSDFRRAVASIDAMPHPANRTCRLRAARPRTPIAGRSPPPHVGIESSACGAPVVTHRVPNGLACLMAHDGGRRRQRSQSPGLAERVIAKRRAAKPRPDVVFARSPARRRLSNALPAYVLAPDLLDQLSLFLPPLRPAACFCAVAAAAPATALATAARALVRSAALAALARRVGRIGDRRSTRLAHPLLAQAPRTACRP